MKKCDLLFGNNPPAHNLKAAGSNPAPATNLTLLESGSLKNLTGNTVLLAQFAKLIDEFGLRLREFSSLINSPSLASPGLTYREFCDQVIVAKAAKGVRDRTLTQLRHSLATFGAGQLARPADSFTAEEIEEFIISKNWAAATRRSFLTDLRTAFNWGVRRGVLKSNPALAVEMPLLDDSPIKLHSPEEVRRVLHTAQATDKDVMRLLAIQYFGGLRPEAEAQRLDEAKILPSLVDVTFSKMRRTRRLVTILPAARAFLDAGGSLPVVNLKRRFEKVVRDSGVEWAQDVTRHSFATYHLAAFGDAEKTTGEMGHRSRDMLYSKYRELRLPDGQLVTPELAAAFWAIRPA